MERLAESQVRLSQNIETIAAGQAAAATAAAAKAPEPAKPALRSVIQVSPKLTWPSLSDSNTGPQDSKLFFEDFEAITKMANDGLGMKESEILTTLKGVSAAVASNGVRKHCQGCPSRRA